MAVYLGNSYIGKIAISTVAAGSNLQTKTVTPNTSTQTITPDTGYTGLGTVKVNPIPSSYIQPSGSLTITSNGTKDVTSYASVVVNVPVGSTINNQSKTVTPSTSQQVVSPDSGYTGLDSVTVNAIPSSYVQPSATKGATTYTPGTSNQTIAAGTYLSGTQTIKGDSNLTAANIKSGVKIFNITGTYSGSGGSAPSLQEKTNITPTESSQTIIPDSGYDGLSSVQINAISSTYIGSEVARKSSSDLTVNGATITAPAGYYSAAASKSVNTMTLPTAATSSATSGYTFKATIGRSTSAQYINIPPGYNSAGGYYTISAVANGSATAPSTISGSSASVSTGTNTLTLTKTISVTPSVSAGYISSGTAGNSSVSLTASVTTKAAATITPGTSNQTIASGTYLTGTQTIKGDSNLKATNIASGVSIFGVSGSLAFQTYYTGSSAPASSLGTDGDVYLEVYD